MSPATKDKLILGILVVGFGLVGGFLFGWAVSGLM